MIKAVLFDYFGVIGDGHALDQQVINLAKRLKQNYIVALASNLNHEYLDPILEEASLDTLFDPIFISSKIGSTKPAAEFYLHVCEALNLRPDECLMVDDSPRNIAGAEAVGMAGIVFENTAQLEEDMRSYIS